MLLVSGCQEGGSDGGAWGLLPAEAEDSLGWLHRARRDLRRRSVRACPPRAAVIRTCARQLKLMHAGCRHAIQPAGHRQGASSLNPGSPRVERLGGSGRLPAPAVPTEPLWERTAALCAAATAPGGSGEPIQHARLCSPWPCCLGPRWGLSAPPVCQAVLGCSCSCWCSVHSRCCCLCQSSNYQSLAHSAAHLVTVRAACSHKVFLQWLWTGAAEVLLCDPS